MELTCVKQTDGADCLAFKVKSQVIEISSSGLNKVLAS